jgi:hypothetical protein
MLSTSGTTPPEELMAEVGWDLPDKEIIKSKLRLMERLLRREWNCRAEDEEKQENGDRRDGPSLVLRQRIRDVEAGETTGFCAEVKRLWQEADMSYNWPPSMGEDDGFWGFGDDIEKAATTISNRRMESAIRKRSANNPDTPYEELWDGSYWRLTNGTRRQVGLMVSARLDALVLNDSGPMQNRDSIRSCACCGSGYDNLQHLLLSCRHERIKDLRDELDRALVETLNNVQKKEVQEMSKHQRKMLLLGKQLRHELSRTQQKRIDSAMKKFLQDLDDYRTNDLDLNPMCGRTYTRPPEESMQQAAQWDRMWREDMRRTAQGGGDIPVGSDEDQPLVEHA